VEHVVKQRAVRSDYELQIGWTGFDQACQIVCQLTQVVFIQ
jgi:hypothetical protein